MNITDIPYGTLTGAAGIGTGTAPGAAPPPVRSPLAGGGFVGSGGTYQQPDWDALIRQWMTPYEQMNSANLAALQAQIDAQSRLANQRFQGSDTSTLARLSDVHDTNVRNIIHSLAGRGLINSGDTPFQQNREALRYKRDTTDASNQLLDYLTGLQQSYADAQRQGLFGLQNQRLSLASTLGSMYGPTYTSNQSQILGSGFGAGTASAPTAAPTNLSSIYQKVYG